MEKTWSGAAAHTIREAHEIFFSSNMNFWPQTPAHALPLHGSGLPHRCVTHHSCASDTQNVCESSSSAQSPMSFTHAP